MSRIKQLFKSLAGAVLIALAIFLLLPSTEVQASYATMTENDPGLTGSTSLEGGPTYRRTGWIFYLLDMEGNKVGITHAMGTYENIKDRNGNDIPQANIYIRDRVATEANVAIHRPGAEWGAPWDDAQNLRGDEVYQWLTTKRPDGHPRATAIIQKYWGQEKAQQWENKELVLCFEPFAWFCIYKNNGNAGSPEFASGKWICATVRWLGLIQRGIEGSLKRGDYGSSMIGSITNGVFPNSMVIHPDPILKDLGLAPAIHGGKVTNNEMGCNIGWVPGYSYTTTTGWGMGLLVNEVQAINTYSPVQGSPGKPEDPHPDKIGQCTIIKGYYTENLDTGVKTSDGVYVQKETTNKIMISDEPEYKVVSWSTSPVESNPNPVNWAPPSPTQSGTHAQSVELKTPEKVLYVL